MPAVFWAGERNLVPRPVLLSNETLLDVAIAGALHLDYGWPIENLGFQSRGYEFDVAAYEGDELVIAAESKARQREVGELASRIAECGRRGAHPETECATIERRAQSINHHRKYGGLVSLSPRVL